MAANAAKRRGSQSFVLLVRAREDSDDTKRVGYTVTKKIGGSVVRNRFKRRLREAARAILPESGHAGCDHVLIARQGGIERDFQKLCTELRIALERIAK